MTNKPKFEFALDIGKKALEAIREEIKTGFTVHNKQIPSDVFTSADITSEKVMMDSIKAEYSEDLILSEETQNEIDSEKLLSAPALWVLDPIDGTVNFKLGHNQSGISIGYVENGVIQFGLIFDIFNHEYFYALRSEGAFYVDIYERQHQMNFKDGQLKNANVYTNNSYENKLRDELIITLAKVPSDGMKMIRNSAVLDMAHISRGIQAAIYFHNDLKPWDNAAGHLIVQEAGATLCDFHGNAIDFTSPEVLFGSPTPVREFIEFYSNL